MSAASESALAKTTTEPANLFNRYKRRNATSTKQNLYLSTVGLTAFDVVAVDQVLIAQIQFAIADDGMRPDAPLRTANFRLRVQFEAAFLRPAFGRSFHQSQRAT